MANQTLQITEKIYEYYLQISPEENHYLKQLREKTSIYESAIMMSSPEQVAFFTFLIKLFKPKKILELGTYTGYCTLAMALASNKTAQIATCDVDVRWPSIGKEYWEKAGVNHKIKLMVGPALNALDEFTASSELFDFIFIDADKANYWNYFRKTIHLLTDNGIIAIDNVLWSGKPADISQTDAKTNAIRDFNTNLKKFPGINYCVLPIGDGLTLVSKKEL